MPPATDSTNAKETSRLNARIAEMESHINRLKGQVADKNLTIDALRSELTSEMRRRDDFARHIDRVIHELTPSAETKGAHIGEYSFVEDLPDAEGEEHAVRFLVPWDTVKDIMQAIRERTGLPAHKEVVLSRTQRGVVPA